MGAAQRIRGYNDLIGLVYDGVEEPRPWRSLMSRLSEQTSSRDANLMFASPATPGAYVLITDNDDPIATGRTHVDGVMSVNPLLEQPLPQAITLDELIDDIGADAARFLAHLRSARRGAGRPVDSRLCGAEQRSRSGRRACALGSHV